MTILSQGESKKPWIKRYLRETSSFYRAVIPEVAWKSKRSKEAIAFYRDSATGKIHITPMFGTSYLRVKAAAKRRDVGNREFLGVWASHIYRGNQALRDTGVVMPLHTLKWCLEAVNNGY